VQQGLAEMARYLHRDVGEWNPQRQQVEGAGHPLLVRRVRVERC